MYGTYMLVIIKNTHFRILRITEAGLVEKWKQDMLLEKTFECIKDDFHKGSEDDGEKDRPMTLTQLQGVFYILLLGNFFALVVAVGECIFAK